MLPYHLREDKPQRRRPRNTEMSEEDKVILSKKFLI